MIFFDMISKPKWVIRRDAIITEKKELILAECVSQLFVQIWLSFDKTCINQVWKITEILNDPDPRPIQHLWDELEHRLWARPYCPTLMAASRCSLIKYTCNIWMSTDFWTHSISDIKGRYVHLVSHWKTLPRHAGIYMFNGNRCSEVKTRFREGIFALICTECSQPCSPVTDGREMDMSRGFCINYLFCR